MLFQYLTRLFCRRIKKTIGLMKMQIKLAGLLIQPFDQFPDSLFLLHTPICTKSKPLVKSKQPGFHFTVDPQNRLLLMQLLIPIPETVYLLVQPGWRLINGCHYFGRLCHQLLRSCIIPVTRSTFNCAAFGKHPADIFRHKLIPFLFWYGAAIQFELTEIKLGLYLAGCTAGTKHKATKKDSCQHTLIDKVMIKDACKIGHRLQSRQALSSKWQLPANKMRWIDFKLCTRPFSVQLITWPTSV